MQHFDVPPLQAQVNIRDPLSTDYPQWDTGNEPVVATSGCIAIATRGDIDGLVAIEVTVGRTSVPDAAQLIFDGRLLLRGHELVVGNYLASEEHAVTSSPGWHRVSIYTRPIKSPADTVLVFVDADSD